MSKALNRVIELAGSEEKLVEAFNHAAENGRPDLVEIYNKHNHQHGDKDALAMAAEMAVRHHRAKTTYKRPSALSGKSVKDLVQIDVDNTYTPRKHAEALQALRKSGSWDGVDDNHPIVKELRSRMSKNMHTFNRANANDSAGVRPINSQGHGLSLDNL